MAGIDYLIDGADLRVPGVREIADLTGALAAADVRGSNAVVPGVDGETWVPKAWEAGSVELGIVVHGTGLVGVEDALRALVRVVKPGREVTMTRRRTYSTGTETVTCRAEYASGLSPALAGRGTVARVVVVLRNLDGVWHGPATVVPVTGQVEIAGDVPTNRVTVVLTGGTDPVLTNTTTGHQLKFAGAVPAGGVTVDAVEMTATNSSGGDVSSALSWTRNRPMRLDPGPNDLTLSGGGTAEITYRGAYL